MASSSKRKTTEEGSRERDKSRDMSKKSRPTIALTLHRPLTSRSAEFPSMMPTDVPTQVPRSEGFDLLTEEEIGGPHGKETYRALREVCWAGKDKEKMAGLTFEETRAMMFKTKSLDDLAQFHYDAYAQAEHKKIVMASRNQREIKKQAEDGDKSVSELEKELAELRESKMKETKRSLDLERQVIAKGDEIRTSKWQRDEAKAEQERLQKEKMDAGKVVGG